MHDGPAQNRSSGPTQGDYAASGTWRPRPVVAHAIAVALRGLPILIGVVVGVAAARLLPRPQGLGWIAWLAAVVAASQIAVRIGERLAGRLLPLPMLLQFSLAFPDQAPSRVATALRDGNVMALRRRAREAVDQGLPGNLPEAVSTALAMISALNDHDRGTRGHSERVRAIADVIAVEMGLDRASRERLRWGALLHDMGKLTVPSAILNKAGRPSEDEWAILQRHPAEGGRILAPMAGWLGDAVHAAEQHHERWDGNGYPHGLKGEEIALSARIVAVADAVAVMTGARAYKKPLPMAAARQEITKHSGTQFDPTVVRALLAVSAGRLSKASGPLASLASVPVLGSILSAAPAIPAVVGSGVAAAAMSVGIGTVGTPLEWIQPTSTPAQLALEADRAPATVSTSITSTTTAAAPSTEAPRAPSLVFDDGDGAVLVDRTEDTVMPTAPASSTAIATTTALRPPGPSTALAPADPHAADARTATAASTTTLADPVPGPPTTPSPAAPTPVTTAPPTTVALTTTTARNPKYEEQQSPTSSTTSTTTTTPPPSGDPTVPATEPPRGPRQPTFATTTTSTTTTSSTTTTTTTPPIIATTAPSTTTTAPEPTTPPIIETTTTGPGPKKD